LGKSAAEKNKPKKTVSVGNAERNSQRVGNHCDCKIASRFQLTRGDANRFHPGAVNRLFFISMSISMTKMFGFIWLQFTIID
jgi:hypothetical protein